MDVFDRRILKALISNSKSTLREIGRKAGLFSASSISKRISSLEAEGYIKGYRAVIDYEKLGYNFITVTLIRAKYRENYSKEIGKKLSQIPGVISVYFLLGEIDFIVITVSKNKDDYARILDRISSIDGIIRSDTRTILETYKEHDFTNIEI